MLSEAEVSLPLLCGGSYHWGKDTSTPRCFAQHDVLEFKSIVMEEFTIHGDGGDFLRVTLIEVLGFPDSTCYLGGYDVRAAIHIKSGNYEVNSAIYMTTGEIYTLFEGLSQCNEQLSGEAALRTFEDNLELVLRYDIDGGISASGKFWEFHAFVNELRFEFGTDQSYITSTLNELKKIAAKYGGLNGNKD